MVAYSFQGRFVSPIRAGLGISTESDDTYCGHGLYRTPSPKRQTIRAEGKKRHSRVGEVMQLYHKLRHLHRGGFKIGDSRCTDVRHIRLDVESMAIQINGIAMASRDQREQFSRADGFDDLEDMQQFWMAAHKKVQRFEGLVFNWAPL